MDKRYQVFVSSTYEDLKTERQEVMQALLELDCIPAGMELFPAADDDQWTLIRRVIDDCDYYIVIVGGRYGSLGPGGLSYTQMEYEYALERGKPVIAFLHKDPSAIAAKMVEQDPENKKKLEAFRALTQKKACRFWESPKELGSVVSRSIVKLVKSNPGVGWVKADLVPNESAANEILKLKKQVEDLQSALAKTGTEPPSGTELLAQGDDTMPLRYRFGVFKTQQYRPDLVVDDSFSATWNDIFSQVAPSMIDETSEQSLRRTIDAYVEAHSLPKQRPAFSGSRLSDFRIHSDDFQTIKVQFRALGLIAKKEKPRSLKDTDTYWTLTPLGDRTMTQLRAIRRKATD